MFFDDVVRSKNRFKVSQKDALKDKYKNFVIELEIRGFSCRTIDAYLYHNSKFLDFIKKEPKFVTTNDIKSYLGYLTEKGCKNRTINLAISSLKTYYDSFLGRRLFYSIKRSKVPKDLPDVLSIGEIKQMIDCCTNMKHRLLIELLYSSGLRIGECVKLKIDDINIAEKTAFVRCGKGRKDRFVILSQRFIVDLKEYIQKSANVSDYVFASSHYFSNRSGHITIRTGEEIVRRSAIKAGIRKRVYPHLLRASFATHLLEKNTSIFLIQKLLGHSRIQTTESYIRVKTADIKKVVSPLDS